MEGVALTVILRYSSSNISRKISSPFQKKQHGHTMNPYGYGATLVFVQLCMGCGCPALAGGSVKSRRGCPAHTQSVPDSSSTGHS